MAITVMTPWSLVCAHRYDEAIAAYKRQVGAESDDNNALAEMATALVALRRYNEARKAFLRAHDVSRTKLKGSGAYLANIATCEYMLGQTTAATTTLSKAVEGVLSGTIKYADPAGGVSQGLLLWYIGVGSERPQITSAALNYLTRLSKNAKVASFPGPVALYILGERPFMEVLQCTARARNVAEAVSAARSDLLMRRQLCQLLFYESIARRASGDEAGCMEGLKLCRSLENPILENEWYLARFECDNAAAEIKRTPV